MTDGRSCSWALRCSVVSQVILLTALRRSASVMASSSCAATRASSARPSACVCPSHAPCSAATSLCAACALHQLPLSKSNQVLVPKTQNIDNDL